VYKERAHHRLYGGLEAQKPRKCNIQCTKKYMFPEHTSENLCRYKWAGHVARMGEGRGVHRVLVGKPEGKRPLGRPRRRWGANIKMDLREVGGGGD